MATARELQGGLAAGNRAEIGQIVDHRPEAGKHLADRPQFEFARVGVGQIEETLHALQRGAQFVRDIGEKSRPRPRRALRRDRLGFGERHPFVIPLPGRRRNGGTGRGRQFRQRAPGRPDIPGACIVVDRQRGIAERPGGVRRALTGDAGLQSRPAASGDVDRLGESRQAGRLAAFGAKTLGPQDQHFRAVVGGIQTRGALQISPIARRRRLAQARSGEAVMEPPIGATRMTVEIAPKLRCAVDNRTYVGPVAVQRREFDGQQRIALVDSSSPGRRVAGDFDGLAPILQAGPAEQTVDRAGGGADELLHVGVAEPGEFRLRLVDFISQTSERRGGSPPDHHPVANGDGRLDEIALGQGQFPDRPAMVAQGALWPAPYHTPIQRPIEGGSMGEAGIGGRRRGGECDFTQTRGLLELSPHGAQKDVVGDRIGRAPLGRRRALLTAQGEQGGHQRAALEGQGARGIADPGKRGNRFARRRGAFASAREQTTQLPSHQRPNQFGNRGLGRQPQAKSRQTGATDIPRRLLFSHQTQRRDGELIIIAQVDIGRRQIEQATDPFDHRVRRIAVGGRQDRFTQQHPVGSGDLGGSFRPQPPRVFRETGGGVDIHREARRARTFREPVTPVPGRRQIDPRHMPKTKRQKPIRRIGAFRLDGEPFRHVGGLGADVGFGQRLHRGAKPIVAKPQRVAAPGEQAERHDRPHRGLQPLVGHVE